MTTSTKRLTTAELRQIIDSHEKGHAMVVPINCDYLAAKELLAVREAQPYGYLRENDGQVQISIGPERPPNRSGGYATPWGAIYAAPPAPAVPADVISTLRLALDAMEFMGNALNELDAATPDGIVRVSPAFSAVREMLAAAPTK